MSSKFSGILSQARNREQLEGALEQDLQDAVDHSSDTVSISSDRPESSASSNRIASRTTQDLKSPNTSGTATKSAKFDQSQSRREHNSPNTIAPVPEDSGPEPYSKADQVIKEGRKVPGTGEALRRTIGKRSDPRFTQITAYITKQTHRNVKLALLREGNDREISQLIEERLSIWLNDQNTTD